MTTATTARGDRARRQRPTLAVWKFASCDGCQLTLLDCEDELLGLAEAVHIAHFSEMTRASVCAAQLRPARRREAPEMSPKESSQPSTRERS